MYMQLATQHTYQPYWYHWDPLHQRCMDPCCSTSLPPPCAVDSVLELSTPLPSMHAPAPAACCTVPFHIGCYLDTSPTRLQRAMGSVASAAGCYGLAQAAGYAYFGVAEGTQCYATNDLPMALAGGSTTGCGECGGASSESCGGTGLLSMYGPGACMHEEDLDHWAPCGAWHVDPPVWMQPPAWGVGEYE